MIWIRLFYKCYVQSAYCDAIDILITFLSGLIDNTRQLELMFGNVNMHQHFEGCLHLC